MTDNPIAEGASNTDALPAFHIQRLRREYGESGLTVDELADLAGVPRSLVDLVERAETVPALIDALHRIAFALQAPVDALIDQRHLAKARRAIARRREDREGA